MSTCERTARPSVVRAAALAGAAWFALAGVALAQGQPQREPTRTITKIRGDLYRFTNDRHNTVFLVTTEGVIVGDPINAEAATWLKNQIAERFKVPVRYVLYSHRDWDHASGARVFDDTAELWGHANMPAAIENAPEPERMKDVLPPERTYTDRHTITLGGKRVELVHPGPNHSPDATVLFFPARLARPRQRRHQGGRCGTARVRGSAGRRRLEGHCRRKDRCAAASHQYARKVQLVGRL
jgi:hypothetical protein